MWNPEFEVEATENAVAYGWHRAFSLRIERFRATSEAPGLMLALQRGGSCSGLILKTSLQNEEARPSQASGARNPLCGSL